MPALKNVAVVIPAGPGESAFGALLPALSGFDQIVVSCVTGDPVAARSIAGATVITGPRGRARQLNAGAASTTRPWLLFLHADSRPGAGAGEAVAAAPEYDYLGYFDLRFFDGPSLMILNTAGVWLRCRLLGLPFGDQGLLIRRSLWDRLGGFDEALDRGEDHALVWAARNAGVPVRPLGAVLATSARRYVRDGWWAVTRHHLASTWTQAWSARIS